MVSKRIPIAEDTPENRARRQAENRKWSLRAKERWMALSPEERVAKKKAVNDRYKEQHPGEKVEWTRRWRRRHPDLVQASYISAQNYRRNNKRRAIEYLGGKCMRCGGVFHDVVYDFHHTDATVKDVCVARLMGRKFDATKSELDKCLLLCANCHRLAHWEYDMQK